MADLVRFYIFRQSEFAVNDSKNEKAIITGLTSYSEAKKEAQRIYERERKPLVITQTNPRRRGPWHNVRMRVG